MTGERMIALPAFAVEVLEDLRRFQECVEDNNDVNLERSRFDLLVQLGLLERVQRSPARWMMTQAGEDAIAKPAAGHLVAVVGTVPDGSGFKSLDFNVELESLPDGTRLYAAAHGDEAATLVKALSLLWETTNFLPRGGSLDGRVSAFLTQHAPEPVASAAAMRAQGDADRLNRAEPAAPVASNDPALVGALASIVNLSRALRQGGPAPEDLQELSDALEEAVAIAHDAVAGLPDPDAAIRSIAHERQRQIEGEGWSPESDDQYQQGELAKAAAGYVLHAHADQSWKNHHLPNFWPFSPQWFKPADPRRMLVKAGALVVAEIQRIDRAEARAQEAGQ